MGQILHIVVSQKIITIYRIFFLKSISAFDILIRERNGFVEPSEKIVKTHILLEE